MIASNNHSAIIKDISFCSFPYLTNVDIGSNNLESVEQLSFINIPQLQDLWINTKYNDKKGNHIINIRLFRKANWPKLDTISVSNQYFMQVETKY